MNTGKHASKTNLHYRELCWSNALACRNAGGVPAALSLSAILRDDVTRFEDAAGPTGGYPWSCGGEGAITKCVAQLHNCMIAQSLPWLAMVMFLSIIDLWSLRRLVSAMIDSLRFGVRLGFIY